jgi:hypothetical protein
MSVERERGTYAPQISAQYEAKRHPAELEQPFVLGYAAEDLGYELFAHC